MIKLSVITVTYNAEQTLERTIKSVQEQSYPHIQHIIADGNSKDKTVDLIEKYSTNKTIWKSEPDKGIYDAMNKAVAWASGDYLCFLNSGDTFFESSSVEKMITKLDENNLPDIIYGETAIVDNQGNFLYMRRLNVPEILTWKSFKQGMLVCHQAFIIKRSLFEPYDLKYHFSADFDWCIRMMKKASSLLNSNLTLIRYLNEGTTTANRKASLIERYKIMSTYYGKVSTFIYHLWFVIRAIVKPQK
ncbi:MAG: glycosyltransferase family 2 protein [Dysgonamonadaceae bacterium]